MPRRIVIDLYDHTTQDEIDEIIESIRCIGIDDAYLESEADDAQ